MQNKRIADLLGVPFVDCDRRRFNLAVRNIFEKYENILSSIDTLI